MASTNISNSEISEQSKKAELLLKILANSNRLMILCYLIKQPYTVNELVELIDLSQSAVSQHLAKLRQSDIVSAVQMGTKVLYRIQSPQVNAIIAVLQLIYCAEEAPFNPL